MKEKRKRREERKKKKGIKIKRNFKIVKLKNINNNNKGKKLCDSSIFLLQLRCLLRRSSGISRNIFGIVGSVESILCKIFPCSSLYLFSKSIVAPQMHSL